MQWFHLGQHSKPGYLVLLATWFAFAPVFAQDAPIFRASAGLVHVDAQVTRDGRLIPELKQEDFVILDNGQPQRIVNFSHSEEPLDLVLVFDISGSMRPKIEQVVEAARLGLAELREGDRVSVAAFNTEVWEVSPFSGDLDAVEAAIHMVLDLEFGGGTLILKALEKTLTLFDTLPSAGRRRAVLMVTDNIGFKDRREGPIVRKYWEADALLTGMLVRDLSNRIRRFTPGGILSRPTQAGVNGVVDGTGGELVDADDAYDFAEAMRRIRQRYTLYYNIPSGKPGERRRIALRLSPEASKQYPKAKVLARKGYMLP
jgi:VWFA-related protein